MSNTSTHSSTRRLTEGGICIALALVLSYLKIPIGLSFGGFGGSITLVMVPLILFAVRYGAPGASSRASRSARSSISSPRASP